MGLAGECCSFLAAEAREDWRLSHDPLHRTIRIAPVTLDYETARTRLGIRQLVRGVYLYSQYKEEHSPPPPHTSHLTDTDRHGLKRIPRVCFI